MRPRRRRPVGGNPRSSTFEPSHIRRRNLHAVPTAGSRRHVQCTQLFRGGKKQGALRNYRFGYIKALLDCSRLSLWMLVVDGRGWRARSITESADATTAISDDIYRTMKITRAWNAVYRLLVYALTTDSLMTFRKDFFNGDWLWSYYAIPRQGSLRGAIKRL
ncbi:hypothetical protein HN011_006295 [Eciton burchellii]|nr:hypothetical protein HN011_006295 [Eciton burchellii]